MCACVYVLFGGMHQQVRMRTETSVVPDGGEVGLEEHLLVLIVGIGLASEIGGHVPEGGSVSESRVQCTYGAVP